MRVLVIGASKDIGLETVRQAIEASYSVRVLACSVNSINLTESRLSQQ